MKATGTLKASMVLVGLAFTSFFAIPCRAQSEVAPDYFEPGPAKYTPQQQAILARHNERGAADFQGSFSLHHKVQCAGDNLTPGDYSLSVSSAGRHKLVTLRGRARS
ncbi:MAG: hypothetical protein WBC04_24730 [Candidatus Acidiferrales bacterium]